jgi:hypothetical protein
MNSFAAISALVCPAQIRPRTRMLAAGQSSGCARVVVRGPTWIDRMRGVTVAVILGDLVGSEVPGRSAAELESRPERFAEGNVAESAPAPRRPGTQ